MVEILIPLPPTKFAKYVTSWGCIGGDWRTGGFLRARHGSRVKPKQMIPSKSYDLGAYPPNVIGDNHL